MARLPGLLATGLLLAGCTGSAPPTRFYQMIPLAETATAPTSPTRLLAVAKIQLPEYLDRPQIVSRATDTRLVMADFDQWSESFDQMFSDVFVENLRRKLGGEHVILLPNDRDFRPSIELDLTVLRFDTDATGKVQLQTRWRLFNSEGSLLATERTDLAEQATVGDYPSMVDAMSRAVEDLAARVVTVLPAAIGERSRGS